MGEARKDALRLELDRRLKLDFTERRLPVTPDCWPNRARLPLFALAYNLGNFLRRLALPKSVKEWSLTTLREKLIKIGTKVDRYSQYMVFQMAEVAVPRPLFRELFDRIRQLRLLAIPVRPG